MPYLILGVFAQTTAACKPNKGDPWQLYRSLGGISAGMTIQGTAKPTYPGTSFDQGLRVLAVFQNADLSFRDEVVTLEWSALQRCSRVELDLGEQTELMHRTLSTMVEMIKAQERQRVLLCELAGGVVAKAVGEFGLLVPVDKKAAGEPPHEKEQDGADECSAAD